MPQYDEHENKTQAARAPKYARDATLHQQPVPTQYARGAVAGAANEVDAGERRRRPRRKGEITPACAQVARA